MPEVKNSFKFEVVGAITTGIKDRWVADNPGEINGIEAVVGTAPTGANLTFDIQKNGASVFTTQVLAQVATGSTAQGTTGNVNATQTYVDVQLVAGTATSPAKEIAVGSTILIDTEQLVVTGVGGSPAIGGAGLGNVARLNVTRAANGTVAAAHNAGANVTYALPFIAATATTLSQGYANVDLGGFVQGDVLALNVTQVGSTVAGSDLDLIVGYESE